MQPKLTVIVPTIERPDTLYWTLKTVTSQDYGNFAIIVSDNASTDNTAEVVAAFNDPRITYINPGKRLSMARHWEFALAHVKEGYVSILGDDDGLLPGALSHAAMLLNKYKVPAIGWRFGNYNWPGLSPHFMVPMGNYYRLVNAREEVARVFNTQNIVSTIQFPSLYGGFISIDVINGLKEKFGGQFYHSRIPDFFSGGAVAATVDQYLRLHYPLSLNATSKHSTGYATINSAIDQKAINDLQSNSDNIPFHPQLVFSKTINMAIAEAMLQVHEKVPGFPKLSIEKIITETAQEVASTESDLKYRETMDTLLEIGRRNNLLPFAESTVAANPHQPLLNIPVKHKYSPVSETIYLDTTGLKINNVFDACNVAASMQLGTRFELKGTLQQYVSKVQQGLRYLYLKANVFPKLKG